MRKIHIITIGFSIIAIFLMGFVPQNGQTLLELTPKEILQKMDAKLRGVKTSQGELKLTISRPTWKQEMTLKTWTKGQDYALVLITAPARDKGTSFLKNKKDLWNWQPKIGRSIKLPPSMLAQNWMGSDFTMDDLVKQASLVDDYTHTMLGSETVEGYDCYKIELKPKAQAAVVWGKIIMRISKKEFMQLKAEFFDEDAYLVHTTYGKKIKTLAGRTLPTLLEVVPAEEAKNKTTIEYLNLAFDKTIEDAFFSLVNLKKLGE